MRNPSRPAPRPARHILDRDGDVVKAVAEFGVLRSSHIKDFVFFKNASKEPCRRSIERLVGSRHLLLCGQDFGFTGGTSRGWAYQLGPEGWKYLEREGRYYPRQTVNLHTIGIADCKAGLLRSEHFKLQSFKVEPRRIINGVRLDPDAAFNVERDGKNVGYILEVDVARWQTAAGNRLTASKKAQLKDKCRRYWDAATSGEMKMPYVLFVAPDPYRMDYIAERIVGKLPTEQQPLFRTCLLADLPQFPG